MKALVIGVGGFVGPYLVDYLINEEKYEVLATKLETEDYKIDGVKITNLNILDKQSISNLLNEYRPEYIFHLAAQSSVALSWKKPNLTVNININGTINLLEAVKELDYKPTVLLVGSGEEYGMMQDESNIVNENHTLNPTNMYAVTKTCQNMIGKIYVNAYGMHIIMVRAFNHIGPRQITQFVVSDFCKQVADIEKGIKEPIVSVGNLSAMRDFTDVRDIVAAYSKLIKTDGWGETYNVGTGRVLSIQSILDKIIDMSTVGIRVSVDPSKFRPIDVKVIQPDITKLKATIDWKPKYSIDDTIKDVLNYWRNN